jgi:tRNA A-37 threonylcarbamoyl transferase component Bud32
MLKEGAYAEENAEQGIEHENAFSKETLKRLIESHQTPTDFGKSGILFRIANEELSPEDQEKMAALEGEDNPEGSVSIKALKVFDIAKAQQEFASLKEARSIILKNMESSSLPIARIPRALGCDEIQVDKATQDRLNANGANIRDGRVGIITMDWIEGKDLAAVLHEELLRRDPNNEGIQQGNIWDNPNFERLLRALEKTDFVLPEALLDQLKNTIDVMHSNKFYHNDLHLRNVILKDGDLENPQLYMIDFADATREKTDIQEAQGEYFLSDENIVNNLRPLTKSAEEKQKEYEKNILAEWNARVLLVEKQPKTLEQYQSMKLALEHGNTNMLEGQFAISSGKESDFENYLGNLLKMSRENEVYHQQIKEFLSKLIESQKNKTKNFYALNRLQSLHKIMQI